MASDQPTPSGRERTHQQETQRAYYLAHRDKIRARSKAWREKNPERYHAQMVAFQQKNAARLKEEAAKRYRKNAEYRKAKARERHARFRAEKIANGTFKTLMTPEQRKAARQRTIKAWRERNADQARAAVRRHYAAHREQALAWHLERRTGPNREAWLAWSREYRKKNQHKRNAASAKRRAQKRGLTVEQSAAVDAFYEWVRTAELVICFHCDEAAPKGKRHVDHLIPLKVGGPHTLDNLVASCERCNCQKGPRTVAQFRGLVLHGPECASL
jgi:5-methylcytosine-specific restriction endonuclease McrA